MPRTMPRTPVWKSIAETLSEEIARGHYKPGDKLPTEAELSARFGVNRHTVRHALSDLGERGIVRSRRGAGVFVQSAPVDYPLGKRVRFHQNIRATGRLPNRRVLRLETRPCDATEASVLALSPGENVLIYEGLSLSGDTPVAHFISIFPITRLVGLDSQMAQTASVTEGLKAVGIEDYVRAETRVSAERTTTTQALHLGLREGDPLLHTVSLNSTLDGIPVERGLTWFAGDRVTLTVTPD
ncbi:GntR family transcriptional regulator, phosphonate transport system regulatory protein [Celeribacter baekdonensis]|jgi:GntR family phosphonate transport system transcriptional regulator|uniref:GntR family transcriptional regulator, phosphonate transport system regulatory protein n=1 Tax=Celeribacter baekdonensis TaxID=875171 RepID=A0A1G7K8N2_9RHOB|nr:phosphonate metabolism transcriptional regulator PhnF [Celeribacter baekdonensis]SDF33381.1 GntR family transcriptional regulator, phosphonate transport system regulatory protein [Celeribacter baekdonensis]